MDGQSIISEMKLIEGEIKYNLNELVDDNNSCKSNNIEVVFRDIKSRLISLIEESDIVLGAVAWLTDKDILESLKKVQCQITLQKEDFLRPDLKPHLNEEDKVCLKDLYDSLTCNLKTNHFHSKIYELSKDNILDINPITCFGYFNSNLRHCTPKMHNKFFVFAKLDEELNKVKASKVWTGSANITNMSMSSLENGVIISDEIIAWHYLKEYEHIYSLSENLDWNADWYNLRAGNKKSLKKIYNIEALRKKNWMSNVCRIRNQIWI
jgi:hypothetical protein